MHGQAPTHYEAKLGGTKRTATAPTAATYNPYLEAQKASQNRLNSMKTNQIGQVGDAYSQANKNAYIAYQQSKANMPEMLALSGNTGGMAGNHGG